MAGLVGIAALARLLAGRKAAPVPPALPPLAPETDPAVELRQKLAASRDDSPADETLAGVATESLQERRARVHAKAQEAMDAMDALQEPPS
jgi:hypothetical protein